MNSSSFRTITPEGRAYCGTEVSLDLHTMDAGTRCRIVAPEREEAVVVLLEGALEWAGVRATRRSVFSERASAVYLPPDTIVEIEALETTELALVATLDADITEPMSEPTVVGPHEIVVHDRGRERLAARSARRDRRRGTGRTPARRRDVQPARAMVVVPTAQTRRR